jgi:hypothetical protein
MKNEWMAANNDRTSVEAGLSLQVAAFLSPLVEYWFLIHNHQHQLHPPFSQLVMNHQCQLLSENTYFPREFWPNGSQMSFSFMQDRDHISCGYKCGQGLVLAAVFNCCYRYLALVHARWYKIWWNQQIDILKNSRVCRKKILALLNLFSLKTSAL